MVQNQPKEITAFRKSLAKSGQDLATTKAILDQFDQDFPIGTFPTVTHDKKKLFVALVKAEVQLKNQRFVRDKELLLEIIYKVEELLLAAKFPDPVTQSSESFFISIAERNN